MLLTNPSVKNATPSGKPYKLSDQRGLYLLVTPAGGKLWRYDYRHGGKRKTLAFGAYPEVSLREARERLDDARSALKAGLDPAHPRTPQSISPVLAPPSAPTFKEVALRWYETKVGGWRESHYTRVLSSLLKDVFPKIGHMAVNEVGVHDILSLVRAVESRGALERSKRVKNFCSEVFYFAIAERLCDDNPARDVGRVLKPNAPTKHHNSLSMDRMPYLLSRLDQHRCTQAQQAIRLVLLTVCRTNEARFAAWSEFEDLDRSDPRWRLPAERMKMGSEHIVPLSRQAVFLLKEIRESSSGELLFGKPTRSGVLSENAMLSVLYDFGLYGEATVHGFRATFSTYANETGLWQTDWIEKCLAHTEGNKVRAAYNSAMYLQQRRQLLQWWADTLDERRACCKKAA